ncbi:MAG: alkaline phosphatase family protein [Phycisphaerae bacterium]
MKRIFLLAALWMMSGCAHPGDLKIQLDDQVRVPQRRVLVFWVDGVRDDLMKEMICAGQLPNIQKYLYNRGCHADNAVCCFPSITYASMATANTGLYPGHHQIMGNKWFDRNSGKYQNYMLARTYLQVDHDLRAPTIYEILGDKYTVTIQAPNRRGATRPYDNWMSSGIDWFFDRYSDVDKLVAQRFEEVAACSAVTGRWPDYIFAYFPTLDHIGHEDGANSAAYQNAMINVDDQVGRICRALEHNGLLKDYYLIFTSDHGHVYAEKKNYWLPEDFLRKDLKLPVVDQMFLENKEPGAWHEYLKKYRVVMVDGGPRQAQLHLRCGDHWHDQPSFEQVSHFLEKYDSGVYEQHGRKELIELLTQVPAVRIVTAKVDENNVRVFTADGQGQVTRKINPDGTKVYRYKNLRNDPLGYGKFPFTVGMVNKDFYDSETWLNASCTSEFPDFVPQVIEFYDSPRAGQIGLFAAKGWDFDKKALGGHGSIIRDDMVVPFVVAGPGIAQGSIKTARLVDVMPTVLDMLGCTDRLKTIGPLDGKTLLPVLTGRK